MANNISILLIGPSGAGKGTQARLLVEKYNLHYLQSGEVLRQLAARDDDFGREVKAALQKGFVPSEWIFKIMQEEFSNLGQQGIVIDGFSRKLPEIEMLYEILEKYGRKLDFVFLINVADKKVIERLKNRKICRDCKEAFDVRNLNEEKCPKCGGIIAGREDDNEETIKGRLNDYKTETSQVIDFIKKNGAVIEIDGDRPVEEVFEEICSHIDKG